MAQRKFPFTIGEYYHLYNRGNSKQIIFHDKEDYRRFMRLLFLSNKRDKFKIQFLGKREVFDPINQNSPLVAIGAWTLMPNHFHLLVTPLTENDISKFMQKLTTAYSMYYNQKYKRTGGLFEGKFKSEYAEEDRYLKYLFSYIHLNCIKLVDPRWRTNGTKNISRSVSYLKNYNYSSYIDYSGQKRPEGLIIKSNAFPAYFTKKNSLEKELFEWLSYRQDL